MHKLILLKYLVHKFISINFLINHNTIYNNFYYLNNFTLWMLKHIKNTSHENISYS